MSNSRKIIWITFALFMFIQVGISYMVKKNQNDLSFLMSMKSYIPYMLVFTLAGLVLFLLSFMVYQLDGIKAKKQVVQLENDKQGLKAKLFDLQEAQTSEKLPAPIISPEKETQPKEGPSISDPDSE